MINPDARPSQFQLDLLKEQEKCLPIKQDFRSTRWWLIADAATILASTGIAITSRDINFGIAAPFAMIAAGGFAKGLWDTFRFMSLATSLDFSEMRQRRLARDIEDEMRFAKEREKFSQEYGF